MPPCTQHTKFIILYKPPHRKRKLRTEEKTMFSIPLKTVDELQDICLELEILTYFPPLCRPTMTPFWKAIVLYSLQSATRPVTFTSGSSS